MQRWPQLPLLVLVDGRSASAAEIVAGALQDHDRAVIIGTPTYGKGSAQSVIPFGPDGGLKITTARWFTPVGRSITRPIPSDDEFGDAPPPKRERFHTDGGRTVYGGGGITPDVLAGDSAPPLAEGNLMRALGANAGHFRDAVADYALFLKGTGGIATPDFVVTPEMRSEVWNRMKARGIDIPRNVYDEAEPLVSRVIAFDIARYVFGGEAEFRRRASVDKPLQKALDLAHGAKSEQDLLRRAMAEAPVADNRHRRGRRRSVSERVVIIGPGHVGRGLFRAFRASGVDVVGLHGKRPSGVATIDREYSRRCGSRECGDRLRARSSARRDHRRSRRRGERRSPRARDCDPAHVGNRGTRWARCVDSGGIPWRNFSSAGAI